MTEMEKQATVPYFVHEGQMARMERIFRLTVCALITAPSSNLIAKKSNNI